MPGTARLERLLELVPPPLSDDPDGETGPSGDRDYGPDPVVDVVARFPAGAVFSRKAIEGALYGDLHKAVLCPTYYVVTPSGCTTFLTSTDAPAEGRELIAAWSVDRGNEYDPEAIARAHQHLAAQLAGLPFRFDCTPLDMAGISSTFDRVKAIRDLEPDSVSVTAYHGGGQKFDGRQVWNLLHAIGFRWGDMDCFQWADPTDQTDYLVWVEADDGRLGYVLPEMVATGEQNFHEVRFSFTPPRTPSPLHVLEQMLRAVAMFQQHTGCSLVAKIDGKVVESPDHLMQSIMTLCEKLAAMGLKPGWSTILRTR
ncbi:cell division protein ZipA C-terminal FtsZ-binding domain-containing protein [Ensifer adhaerens]|uniref:cell division protein ZipA C-terminal FtsZ-binding domain-containing protein n=1 Tax=Ensifer adhaerens TaxID=106592 RepID=UPI003CFF1250